MCFHLLLRKKEFNFVSAFHSVLTFYSSLSIIPLFKNIPSSLKDDNYREFHW